MRPPAPPNIEIDAGELQELKDFMRQHKIKELSKKMKSFKRNYASKKVTRGGREDRGNATS